MAELTWTAEVEQLFGPDATRFIGIIDQLGLLDQKTRYVFTSPEEFIRIVRDDPGRGIQIFYWREILAPTDAAQAAQLSSNVMPPESDLHKVLAEFREVVDGIYGTFLDACDGFRLVTASMDQREEEAREHIERLNEDRPELAPLPYGGSEFSYGRSVPAGSTPRYRHLHQVSTETIKQRNEEGGSNFRFIGNMCLVTLYQYWEDNYRALLADALGAKKDQIQVPLFGEIAGYRHAILHHRGVATTDIEKSTTFKWYKRGDPVFLDREKFEEVIDAVFGFLESVEKEPAQFVKRA